MTAEERARYVEMFRYCEHPAPGAACVDCIIGALRAAERDALERAVELLRHRAMLRSAGNDYSTAAVLTDAADSVSALLPRDEEATR